MLIRMTAPVVVTSVLLLVVGVGAAWYVDRLQHRGSEELKANVSSLRAAEELLRVVQEIRTELQYFLMTSDRIHLQAALALRPRTERWLREGERWANSADELDLMGHARRGQHRIFDELQGLLAPELPSTARARVRELIDTVLVSEILEPTQNYLALNAAESEQSIVENQAYARWLAWVLLLLGICGSLAGVIAGFAFARGFQRSLVQLSLPIQAAAGHLDDIGPITVTTSADLGEMEHVLLVIAGRIGTIVDRLRESEREVLRAEQLAAVGQMAAGIAHELGNPLTSMKILVQAAAAGERSGALAGPDLVVLEEEITRLERLVQSFRQVARPPQLEKRVVNVKQLVAETVQLVAPRAASRRTRIELALPTEPVAVALDAAQLRQVLLNLALNALDATDGGDTIAVALRTDVDGWLTLEVRDTGCGLPAALGDRIFAPFVTTKEAGLGLGLSICKRIVEAHGGAIHGANRPGGGAILTVRLPIKEPAADVQGKDHAAATRR